MILILLINVAINLNNVMSNILSGGFGLTWVAYCVCVVNVDITSVRG